MNKIIEIFRGDRCPICAADRCVELYDSKNNPLNYSYIIDTGRYDKLEDKDIYYMRCKKCGKEFSIKWCFDDIKGVTIPKASYTNLDQLVTYASIRSHNKSNYDTIKSLVKHASTLI